MGGRFEGTLEQVDAKSGVQTPLNSEWSGLLRTPGVVPTEHFAQTFNDGDQTVYKSNDFAAKVYQELGPSVGEVRLLDSQGTPLEYGTAFVVNKDGYMLTDRHVVASNMASIQVLLNNQWHTAHWVQGDPANGAAADLGKSDDLALLKIDKIAPDETFKPVRFAPAKSIAADAPLVALGFPLGLHKEFVSPSVGLDGNQNSTQEAPPIKMLALGDLPQIGKIGTFENRNRSVLAAPMETQHGNSGSLVATKDANGEPVVVGIVGYSNAQNSTPWLSDAFGNPIPNKAGQQVPDPTYRKGTQTDSTPSEDVVAFLNQKGIDAHLDRDPVVVQHVGPRSGDNSVGPPVVRRTPPDAIEEARWDFAKNYILEQ